jgi:hypothetical protein
MAIQAVFGTYELLESIVSFLPREDIRTVQFVGKTWLQLVADSTQIRKKRSLTHVAAIGIREFMDHIASPDMWPGYSVTSALSDEYDGGPTYSNFADVVLHPRSHKVNYYDKNPQHYIGKNWQFPTLEDHDLDRLGSEYITEPPIKVIFIAVRKEKERNLLPDSACSIRRQTGITFSDVESAYREMMKSVTSAEKHITTMRLRLPGMFGEGRRGWKHRIPYRS